MGEYSKALENHKKSLSIRLEILGSQHPDISANYNNIGVVYFNQGNYAESLEYYEKAKTILLNNFSKDHPQVKMVDDNIIDVKRKINSYDMDR